MTLITILAQTIPDASEVIENANSRGWEAGMLAVVMVACMGALTYLIHRQNQNATQERSLMAAREERMAARINVLEDELRKMQREHGDKLLEMLKEVTSCILQAKDEQSRMRETLAAVNSTMSTINGDMRELCELLKLSPCLVATMHRGEVKLVDKDGNEIKMMRIDED